MKRQFSIFLHPKQTYPPEKKYIPLTTRLPDLKMLFFPSNGGDISSFPGNEPLIYPKNIRKKMAFFPDAKNPSFEPSRSRLRLRMCDPAPFVEMRRVDIARPLPGEDLLF